MSARGTAFCAAITRVCMQAPRPAPMTAEQTRGCHSGPSQVTRANSTEPAARTTHPSTGIIL